MEFAGKMISLVVLLVVPLAVLGDTCLSPEVKAETYTTTEAIVSTETVFVVQFSLTCKNKVRNINLYADINGRTLPVTKTDKPDVYQVSISDEHKKLSSGRYEVRLFDEEGYSLLRKAQRSGESVDAIKPVTTISFNHPGVWKGPMVQSEFVAVIIAILVWYFAYSTKSQLQSSN
ncbi:translocon-associated protein subunit delta-like [Crassostrea virginica]|uniref:Translocon-associated protein subunit delta n=1 Tax=Crassostrea virginica TaxID=6565 RepID=A0A8B8B4S4_CRAVI|nr:translocon-associated protein subunit delta-like [Crassostrea virginica]